MEKNYRIRNATSDSKCFTKKYTSLAIKIYSQKGIYKFGCMLSVSRIIVYLLNCSSSSDYLARLQVVASHSMDLVNDCSII